MCRCEKIRELWNKEEKTEEDIKALSLAVHEQFEIVSDYYDLDEDVHVWILKCSDCGETLKVPSL